VSCRASVLAAPGSGSLPFLSFDCDIDGMRHPAAEI
jgi:hypothetical protein